MDKPVCVAAQNTKTKVVNPHQISGETLSRAVPSTFCYNNFLLIKIGKGGTEESENISIFSQEKMR